MAVTIPFALVWAASVSEDAMSVGDDFVVGAKAFGHLTVAVEASFDEQVGLAAVCNSCLFS